MILMDEEEKTTTIKVKARAENFHKMYSGVEEGYDYSYTSTEEVNKLMLPPEPTLNSTDEVNTFIWDTPEKPKTLLERLISYLKGLIK